MTQLKTMTVFGGTINRKGFLAAIILYIAIYKGSHFLLDYFSRYIPVDAMSHLMLMSLMGALSLAIFTAFAVKRLRDTGLPTWWVLVYWLLLPFSDENIILINFYWRVDYRPFFIPSIILALVALVLVTVLLLKPGCSKASLTPESEDMSPNSAA